jgi:phosphoadenosine phosphosulfate reductase
MNSIDDGLIASLSSITDPGMLLAELHRRFGDRMAIGTSGQLSGSVLIAQAFAAGVRPRIFTNDTLRLFPETYAFFSRLETTYGFTFERFVPDPKDLDTMIARHGEFLFFDSKDKQEYCCELRKVRPNTRALDTLDVWVTGLRADQSASRSSTPRFDIITHAQGGVSRPILKVAPLVEWTEARLRDYARDHGVPIHPLLEATLPGGWRYESLGCVICTTPLGPHEPRRAGRWRWFNVPDDKKECGLHRPPAS